MTQPLALLIVLLLPGCGLIAPAKLQTSVVLMTDFGLENDAVGLMRGVILSIAPSARVVDLTHRVPRFDVAAGMLWIGDAPGIYPPGSVFVIVVDPGVGTDRRVLAARLASGTILVAPDNGILTGVLERFGPAEVRALDNDRLVRRERSSTFHGRDVFAPLGAHLAGGVPFEEVGPVVLDWKRLQPAAFTRKGDAYLGVVLAIDEPFGNVWTNLPAGLLEDLDVEPGDTVRITFGESTVEVPYASTFADVPRGSPLLYRNSRGRLALALNQGDFARTHGLTPGAAVRVGR